MTDTVHTDGKDEPYVVHLIYKIKPSATLLQHSEKAALPSQTKIINEFHAAEAAKHASEAALTMPIPSAPSTPLAPPPSNKCMHPNDAFEGDESGDMEHENAHINTKCTRRKHKSPELVDEDGVLINVNVSIADPGLSQEGETTDIDTFFGTTFKHTGANGKVKKHRKYNVCL